MKKSKKLKVLFYAVVLFSVSLSAVDKKDPWVDRPIAPAMGIGLGGVATYGPIAQFSDMMRQSREWRARINTDKWTVVEDSDGWPISLKSNDGATAEISKEHSIFMYMYGKRVKGKVTVTWEGDGELNISQYKLIEDRYPKEKRRVYDWNYEVAGIINLNIVRSNPKDHIRNIHIWQPGLEDGKTIFYPAWKEILKPFPYLRFMDWTQTNNSKQADWKDRNLPSNMRQTNVAWEYVIQLSNETKKDPWICIPHLATDDYVVQLARLFKARLDPDLRVYVEYSNEIWNGSFGQTQWSYKEAKKEMESIKKEELESKKYKADRPWEYGAMMSGRRAAQIWKIMAKELGNPERIVRVIADFMFIDRAMEGALNTSNGEGRVDLIALNAYFMHGKALDYLNNNQKNWKIDDAFDYMTQLFLIEEVKKWNRVTSAKTKWPKIPVTCYEGGQHLANPFNKENKGDSSI
jgi:hypothetical protein